ncbi:OsmC family protein [Desulfarculus baarsii]
MEIALTGGKKIEVRWDDFVVEADQSKAAGGEGDAPEPFMLFLASLGACSGMYALSFCQARDIPTAGLKLRQKLVSDAEGKRLEQVRIEIVLPPEFPAKYEKAIVRVADQCAVKKAIQNPPLIETVAVRA